MEAEFKQISLTGRLCWLFMCIERYLTTLYPERDWTPAAKRCWQWTNRFWDEGSDVYAPVVPMYLLEFDSYEETNSRSFDNTLSRKDYEELTALFDGITDGNPDDEINSVLFLPIDFANACECTEFPHADEPTLKIISEMAEILRSRGIEPPSAESVADMTVDIKNGWGDFADTEYLSVILR